MEIEIVKMQVDSMVNSVISGDEYALPVFIKLKKMIDMIETEMLKIKEQATTEVETLGRGEHKKDGAIVSVRSYGAGWVFKHLPDWASKKKELETLESMYKSAYNSKKNGMMAIGEETAEVIQMPIYRNGKDSISVSLPKNK